MFIEYSEMSFILYLLRKKSLFNFYYQTELGNEMSKNVKDLVLFKLLLKRRPMDLQKNSRKTNTILLGN